MHETRRYNMYTDYMKSIFGARVQKISVDAGFTCPNRDGTKGYDGCSYCDGEAFSPSYCKPDKDISQQIAEGIEFHQRRYRKATNYLVYLQSYSNTYKPLPELVRIYEEALAYPQVVGLVIGTRPDTIDEQKLDYLSTLQKNAFIMIEYGVESVYDQTLRRINRGHDFQTAVDAIQLTHEEGIPCGAHFLFGLPGETKAMMLAAAEVISSLPLTSVKFHQLQLFKNTSLTKEYLTNPEDFTLFSLDDYIQFIVEFISLVRPELIIERFAGEVPPRFLVSPPWGKLRYDQVRILIEKKMEEMDVWQGKFYRKTS